MVRVPLALVDSFSTEIFRGNPAGVVLFPPTTTTTPMIAGITTDATEVDTAIAASAQALWELLCSDDVLLSCASELNLSETVFLLPTIPPQLPNDRRPPPSYLIRWFTPEREVGLCGHATLAAAHVLFSSNNQSKAEGGVDDVSNHHRVVRFYNAASGWVSVSRRVPVHEEEEEVTSVNERNVERNNPTLFTCHGGSRRSIDASAAAASSSTYVIDFPLRTPVTLWSRRRRGIGGSVPLSFQEEFIYDLCRCVGLDATNAEEFCLHFGSRKYVLVLKGGVEVIGGATADIAEMRRVFSRWHNVRRSTTTLEVPSSPTHAQQLAEYAEGEVILVPVEPLSLTITSETTSSTDRAVGAATAPPPPPWDGCRVVSRHFAPWVGINEDPVTGAAHVVLVPYWLRRFHQEEEVAAREHALPAVDAEDEGEVPLDKPLVCFQASKRGGRLVCTAREGGRLELEGSAVTFFEGTACIPIA